MLFSCCVPSFVAPLLCCALLCSFLCCSSFVLCCAVLLLFSFLCSLLCSGERFIWLGIPWTYHRELPLNPTRDIRVLGTLHTLAKGSGAINLWLTVVDSSGLTLRVGDAHCPACSFSSSSSRFFFFFFTSSSSFFFFLMVRSRDDAACTHANARYHTHCYQL